MRSKAGRAPEVAPGPSSIAMAYAGIGDKDKSFAWLERSYENHHKGGLGGFYLVMLQGDPLYAPLRGDTRYAELSRRIGLPAVQ